MQNLKEVSQAVEIFRKRNTQAEIVQALDTLIIGWLCSEDSESMERTTRANVYCAVVEIKALTNKLIN